MFIARWFKSQARDPSVHQATSSSAAGGQNGVQPNLDDYNPFDPNKTTTGGGGGGGGGNAPAVMKPSQEPAGALPPAGPAAGQTAPPPYTQSAAQQQISAADFQELQRRQEELERRAADLEAREAALRNTPYNARANNWPPIPSMCPFQPCFYQDINVDIPVEFQKIVTYLYYLWCAHASLLFANMIVGLLYLFAGGDLGSTFALALIYFVLFTPASFLCWFRPAYKAFRDDSSFSFMVFFFVFFFQFLMSCVQFLGVGDTGSCGLIFGLTELGKGGARTFVGVLMLVTALGFGICALADFLVLVRVHRMYRSTGASFAKAQAEFTTGVMKNETVQRAAADAAREGVRNTFNGGQQQQQQAAGSRY